MKAFTPPIIAKTLALTSFASLSFMVAAPAQAIFGAGMWAKRKFAQKKIGIENA